MAHKTLVGGTAYDIIGGTTLVNGTSYKVNGGKVLVGGTAYNLSFMLPPTVLDMWSDPEYTLGANIACITYAEGYWVIGGRRFVNSNRYAYTVAYSTSLDGDWTYVDLWQTSRVSGESVSSVIYGNGYWIVAVNKYDDDYECTCAEIFYSQTIDGVWENKRLWREGEINCATFANGYWVVGGRSEDDSYTYGRVYYNNTTPSGSWSGTSSVWSKKTSNRNVYDITYANGYWVVVGSGGESSDGYIYRSARVAYSSNAAPTSFTEKLLWSPLSSAAYTAAHSITYANGYWVAVGDYGSGLGSSSKRRLAYATSPNGTWTVIEPWTTGEYFPRQIMYEDGTWVIRAGRLSSSSSTVHKGVVYIATSLSGPWTEKEVWAASTAGKNCSIDDLLYADGYYVAVGTAFENSSFHGRIAYAPSIAELGDAQ